MNSLKQYSIPWKGLSNGSHHFDFEIDDRFFDHFEGSGISGGHATVSIDMERSATLLRLYVIIEGKVNVECDRCLDDVELPIDYNGELQVKFSEEIDEYDGDVMWINPSQGELNIAQYIYESIVLGLPYSRVHPEGPDGTPLCNQNMLSMFKIVSGDEFDSLAAEKKSIAETPEAEKLRQLKEKMENK